MDERVASAIFLAGYKQEGPDVKLLCSCLNQALLNGRQLVGILSSTTACSKTFLVGKNQGRSCGEQARTVLEHAEGPARTQTSCLLLCNAD